jgi:hypothetical protein
MRTSSTSAAKQRYVSFGKNGSGIHWSLGVGSRKRSIRSDNQDLKGKSLLLVFFFPIPFSIQYLLCITADGSTNETQDSSGSHISSEQTTEAKPETNNRACLMNGDRSASDVQNLEDEPALVKRRVPTEILRLWQTLLKPRGYEFDRGQLMKIKSNQAEEPLGVEKLDDGVDRRSGSIVGAFRRASPSTRGIHKETMIPLSGQQPFRRQLAPLHPQRVESPRSTTDPPRAVMIFAGMTFRPLGEAKCAMLRREVESCGGRMVESEEDVEVDFIIVRLVRYGLSDFHQYFRGYAKTFSCPFIVAVNFSRKNKTSLNAASIGLSVG